MVAAAVQYGDVVVFDGGREVEESRIQGGVERQWRTQGVRQIVSGNSERLGRAIDVEDSVG
ncbi:hypothetical protein CASFOL_038209 [Castilleja foliolosa]|uniref:Uncharacterized protein n=1 Tax=Castilleja foliolosa TaxID=1961234 RepID=A0ABD3BKB7_9LAMI